MQCLNKTADILYRQMILTTPKRVAQSALRAIDAIQTDKTCNQVLGLAAALICMLHQYDLTHTDVLGIADNMVYSGFNNNMLPEFKAIQNFMKQDWQIQGEDFYE